MNESNETLYAISQKDAQYIMNLISENAKPHTGVLIQQAMNSFLRPLQKTNLGYQLEVNKI
jgi:hypothetical protein